MRLWVYLKSSGQLQYIITSQREGEKEGKEERERRGGSGTSRIVSEKLIARRWQGVQSS